MTIRIVALTVQLFAGIGGPFMQLLSAINEMPSLTSLRSIKRGLVVVAIWTVIAVAVAPSGGLSS